TFDDTQDPDASSQKITAASCRDQAKALAKALAGKHVGGVDVRSDRCASTRDVVVASAAAQNRVARSWVDEESASRAIQIASVTGADVAAMTEKMALVFYGMNGDSSLRAHVVVVAADMVVIEDLRRI